MHIHIADKLLGFGCKVLLNENMGLYTAFKTGGAADVLCLCGTAETAEKAYCFLYGNNIPFRVLGRGSNVLVSDKGYRGVLLKFYGDACITRNNDVVSCSGGMSARKAADYALKQGLGGAEFMGTVPGSMGGLVCMNAGCYGSEMKDIVLGAEGLIDGKKFDFDNENCKFSYRSSIFGNKNCIILNVRLKLKICGLQEITEKTKTIMSARQAAQPLEYPSAGSVFKRQEGIIPAKLIDEAGLKGFKMGGAEVSAKHSGFIVNSGGATSGDIYGLIQYVKEVILKRYAVNLQEEILYIGEF